MFSIYLLLNRSVLQRKQTSNWKIIIFTFVIVWVMSSRWALSTICFDMLTVDDLRFCPSTGTSFFESIISPPSTENPARPTNTKIGNIKLKKEEKRKKEKGKNYRLSSSHRKRPSTFRLASRIETCLLSTSRFAKPLIYINKIWESEKINQSIKFVRKPVSICRRKIARRSSSSSSLSLTLLVLSWY